MKLRTVLGNHAHVQPLNKGELCSDLCELDFIEYAPTQAAFKPMVASRRLTSRMPFSRGRFAPCATARDMRRYFRPRMNSRSWFAAP
jgi:hypothetical protein